MALPKYLEQEIVKFIYAHKNNLLNGITGGQTTEFIDDYGYKYGTQFEEFETDFYQFGPATVESTGTYYKDSAGVYYEDYFGNINTPLFGGDGSTLDPFHIKSIYDANINAGTGIYTFLSGARIESFDAINFCDFSVFSNGASISFDDSLIQSSLGVDSGGVFITSGDLSNNNYSEIAATDISTKMFLNSIPNINSTGIFEIYENTGALEASMSVNNAASAVTASFKIVSDASDLVQPVRFKISGLKTYVDLSAATTDGLVTGDLFIIGTTLNIVP